MSKQFLHWRGMVSGTKAINPPPPVPSRGQLQQAGKTDSAGIKIPGLDMATTSSTCVHALKKRRLQIKQEMAYTRPWNFTLLSLLLSKYKDWRIYQGILNRLFCSLTEIECMFTPRCQMLKLTYFFLLISFPSQYLLFVLSIRSLVIPLFYLEWSCDLKA